MHFANPKVFNEDQPREINSQYFCDLVKRNHHQTQARAPQLAWSMATPWYTPDHLPIQAPLYLDKTFYYRILLIYGAHVNCCWRQWV